MVMQNIGAAKDYSQTYRRFKDSIRLPRDYVSARLDNKVVRHFYTPEQIEGFRSVWV
jgi:hypothetical protein